MPERAAPFVLGQRLYVRFHLALLASLLVAAVLFALAHLRFDPARFDTNLDTIAALATDVLPPQSAAPAVQQTSLQRWGRKIDASLALYGPDRRLLAASGQALPPLDPAQDASGWLSGHPSVFVLKLSDGRWLVGERRLTHRSVVALAVMLIVIAVVVAAGAYPVVRRLTGRLERLQHSVEALGEGQLSSRVAVEGRDEVARLATSFNDAAARIEALVGAQRSLLANASHELRSPLARIRMAVELMQEQAGAPMRAELNRNIAELDQLIDELLLASRLDATGGAGPASEEVDLTGLVAEECARAGAQFDAGPCMVQGDARLLRRMVRNLLENAARYGAGSAVAVRLYAEGSSLRLEVCDGGPGIPEAERERIFAPFYRLPGASEMAGGVGLGLSLVRQIARHHGGEVECLANEAGGCCFSVSLPWAG